MKMFITTSKSKWMFDITMIVAVAAIVGVYFSSLMPDGLFSCALAGYLVTAWFITQSEFGPIAAGDSLVYYGIPLMFVLIVWILPVWFTAFMFIIVTLAHALPTRRPLLQNPE